jgi:two-component system sensor histidine kinase PilS (NtrC family)
MNLSKTRPEGELSDKLKWLMFARILFTVLLLVSTIILQITTAASLLAPGMLFIYGLIVTIFFLSFFYTLMIRHTRWIVTAAYLQIGLDTVIVTLIIFITGNFYSVFSFMYLVVIIYSSMLLYQKGSVLMAALCSFQYSLLLALEYHDIVQVFAMYETQSSGHPDAAQVMYKVLITTVGCFAVAFLSSLLSEQARKSRKELWAMEDHVKRVEKMAAVGEMAAGLAHEIKNPLASLTGSIQILKDSVHLDRDYARLMQIVLREADRLSSLVNNFLLFARPPAGNQQAIELDKSLLETIELFEKDINCRGRITIEKTLSPDMVISIDPVHLRQVLWNLLLNASEAINGDGRIEIRLYPLKGRRVCLEISDNGCGMADETIPSIFDPFFTTKPNGTGLGLSIVHSILESYDCRLDLQSKQAEGTTFRLNFKRCGDRTYA